MSYLDLRQRPNVASMAAVVAIHAVVGSALVLGLTVSGVIPKPEIFTGIDIRPSDPPPPPPAPVDKPAAKVENTIVAPLPPIPLPTQGPVIDTTEVIPPPQPPMQPGLGDTIKPRPSPAPSFAAVAARPRNDPLGWITAADYRSNWITKEMTGRARFRLDIAADGRVTGCAITASSGHPELDAATCTLVSKRARFQPGRDTSGAAAASSYSNAIDWRLPD